MKMKTFIFFFMMTSTAFGMDCAGKMANYSIGIKLHGILSDRMYGEGNKFKDREASIVEACKDISSEQSIPDSISAKGKMLKIIRNDLKVKKKTSSSFLDDFSSDLSGDVTDAQICSQYEQIVRRDASGIEMSESSLLGLGQIDFINGPVEENCRKVGALVKDKYQKQVNEARAEVKREAPGEEISPAEGPIKSRPQEMAPVQRAKVKSSSGSGASSQ